MTQQMIDAFIKKCGSLEEWGGDRKAWHEAMGFFIQGYLAREEAEEQNLLEKNESLTLKLFGLPLLLEKWVGEEGLFLRPNRK